MRRFFIAEVQMEELKVGNRNNRQDQTRLQQIHDFAVENGAMCEGKTIDLTDELIFGGGEVKALEGGKIGGYLVRFSTSSDPDLTGDYFAPDTNYGQAKTSPVLYQHGADKKLGKRQIGSGQLSTDDVGVWIEAQLSMRDAYEKAIYEMAQAGKLGWSSGTLPHLVDREPSGKANKITSWPLGLDASLTPTPAEPRNTAVSLKSLFTDLPEVDELAPTASAATKSDPILGVTKMEPNEIQALIDAALAKRDEAAKAVELKAAELKLAEEAGYKKAVEELSKKIKSVNYVKGQVGDDNDGVQAFKAWAQTGQENDGLIRPSASLLAIKGAGDAFNVTTLASGGALVPDPLYNQIIAKRNLQSWVRMAPTQKFTTTSDHLLIPREVTSHTAFVSTAESAAYDENEGTVGQVDLSLVKYTKLVQVTEEFMAGDNTNWETFFNNAMARAVAVTENTLATTAILATSTAGTAAASQTAITIPEIDALIGSLTNGWNVQGEVGFLMKNSTKWYLKGVAQSVYNAWDFEGYPVYISDDMPARTNGLRSTLFANFQAFAVLERPGILVQRNPYLHMGTGEIDFFCNIYRGFAGLQAEATYTMAQA
jgi:HK97 family phage major capsid protein